MPLGANKAAIMGVAGTSAAAEIALLSSTTVTSGAAVEITSGISSTYKEYIFGFYLLNPESEEEFSFNCSIDGGSNYTLYKTTSSFGVYHYYASDSQSVVYQADPDQDNNNSDFQQLSYPILTDSDASMAGELHLFNPASSLDKHFYAETIGQIEDRSRHVFTAGYFSTTSAINAIKFQFDSGDFDGKIKMWGAK